MYVEQLTKERTQHAKQDNRKVVDLQERAREKGGIVKAKQRNATQKQDR